MARPVLIAYYASGSEVYGDTGEQAVDENFSPMLPISTHGASKLASAALSCSYTHMFDLNGVCFGFANVVGPRQTHGVVYDFVRRLSRDPSRLKILGDRQQSKSYKMFRNDAIKAGFKLG